MPLALPLYNYQEEDVQKLVQLHRQGVCYQMGLGKTATAIGLAERLKLTRILVGTSNRLKYNIAEEIQKFYPEAPVIVLDGPEADKKAQIEEYRNGFLVAGYDSSLQRMTPKRLEKLLKRKAELEAQDQSLHIPHDFTPALSKIKWHLGIFDEAHWMANYKSFHTEGVWQIVKSSGMPLCVPMTGTIIQNQVMDVWPILRLIDPARHTSYWNFAKKWANARPGVWGWEVDPSPNDPVAFQKMLEQYLIYRTDESTAQSRPPVTGRKLVVTLEGKQRELYDAIEQDSLAMIGDDEVLVANNLLAQMTRLRQIAISPRLVGANFDDSPKIDAVIDLCQQADHKVVIFSQFAEVLKLIEIRLQKLGITTTTLRGSTAMTGTEFQCRVREFQEHDNPKVALAVVTAAGEGLTLTAANQVVMVDRHYNPVKNDQPVKRVDRIGQTRPVTITSVVAKDTIEEWIDEKVDGKRNILTQIWELFRQRRLQQLTEAF